ncbi:hypothetical protein [Turneriella parva]|uniref:Uncharacterized protein n=1 Tax=Turneriella parva (strain ATCC BAA-1111 / DSM 21527 / NCTC 11395 / H) TaxID=869212 RepID=I4B8Z7_TURPD|nr:hypothetical protein [Turneriella parva]AFM13754.1 hypothetical protein Turpa_3115 [Turneriella parva DSM 21527]
MVSKTFKTLVVEICASLLIAAALAGFNLVASETPMPEFRNDADANPVLLAHGRGGGNRGGRHHRGGIGHRPRPQGQRHHHGNGARTGNNAPTPQGQPAIAPDAAPQPVPAAPVTGNEPPAVR